MDIYAIQHATNIEVRFFLFAGLFQRAIVQSAHVLSQWTFNPKPVEWGFLLANLLGFEGKDSEDVVDFLKKQPADSITYAVHKLQQRHANVNKNLKI